MKPPRYLIILISVLLILYVGSVIYSRIKARSYEKDIARLEKSSQYVKEKADSTIIAFDEYKAMEERKLQKLDSIIQYQQTRINSLTQAYTRLKATRNELQIKIDSLTSVISLPEL